MINMKNCKGMYELAKALAISKGPRRYGRVAGYCVTLPEVKELYIKWGFSMKRKTMSDHLKTWADVGWVKRYDSGEYGSGIYFFLFNEDPEALPLVKQVEQGFPDMYPVEGYDGVVIG